jgi:hypothetical protein
MPISVPPKAFGLCCYTGPGGDNIEKRKIFAVLMPLLLVSATAFVMTVSFGYAVTPVTATSPTQNITVMLNDFMPA